MNTLNLGNYDPQTPVYRRIRGASEAHRIRGDRQVWGRLGRLARARRRGRRPVTLKPSGIACEKAASDPFQGYNHLPTPK